MNHDDQPRTIPETVHAASFPVYGLVNHPLELFVRSFGLGISHLGSLISTSFTFSSPHHSDTRFSYYSVKNKIFEITSVDAAAQHSEREHMLFDLEEPPEDQVFSDEARWLFQDHHFSEEEQKQAGSPVIWRGTLSLAHTAFSGKILSWKPPLRVSQFLLKSEETILLGNAYGPSDTEILRILEGLQAINSQDDLLRQYQQEIG